MPENEPTVKETPRIEPGTLWTKVNQRTKHALQCGALQPIATECQFIEQKEVNFLVRVLPNLVRKEEAKKQQDRETNASGREFNPFLPYEEDLFVADISDTHLCLLNKFNVIDHHLLIVTRLFEAQDTWLTLPDFEAMWAVLAEIDGLAFYNAGKTAGASQRHKHLQVVPLPIVPNGQKVPIEPLLAAAEFKNSIGTTAAFPFIHAISRIPPPIAKVPLEAASYSLECYYNMLRAVDMIDGNKVKVAPKSGSYNLIATREWMLLVPRSCESFSSIAVNSLGFAGTLFVRNEQQMQILLDCGPMQLLSKVAMSAQPKA